MRTRTFNFYLLFAFALIALASYSTIINSYFLSDDFDQIGKVLRGDFSVTWGHAPGGGFFRPLFIFSYILDGRLWGTNPTGYHLTNLALHAFNSFLVSVFSIRLLRRTGHDESFSSEVAAAAALIFLLHPSHTEAVSWISGRADLMATLLFLAALIAFDTYSREMRAPLLALTSVFFMLALFAKESALCFPFIIILIELFSATEQREAVRLKRAVRVCATLVLVLLIYFLIRYAAIGTFVGVYGASQHLDFKLSLLWEHLPKFLVRALLPPFPVSLSFMFLKPLKSRAFLALALLFMSALSLLLLYRRKRQPQRERKRQNILLAQLLSMFVCAILPVITLGLSMFDTSGERFIYLPSVFSSIALAYIFAALIPDRRAWLLAVAALLIFYSVTLYRSNRRWQEASRLSKSVLDDLVRQADSDDLLILNIPDNLRGVPVYRNGIEQALATFQSLRKIGHAEVVSYHSIQSTSGNIEVALQPELFRIRLLNPGTEFSKINDRSECSEVAEQSKDSLAVALKDCPAKQSVFYFQDDKMKAVPASQDVETGR